MRRLQDARVAVRLQEQPRPPRRVPDAVQHRLAGIVEREYVVLGVADRIAVSVDRPFRRGRRPADQPAGFRQQFACFGCVEQPAQQVEPLLAQFGQLRRAKHVFHSVVLVLPWAVHAGSHNSAPRGMPHRARIKPLRSVSFGEPQVVFR